MKTMRYIIAAATISAALLAGCNKANSPESGLMGAVANETTMAPIAGSAIVNLQLQTLLPPSPLIIWESGTINASEDLINASRLEGNVVEKFTFGNKVARTYSLMGNNEIGSVSVPYYYYLGMSASILADPLDQANALILTGVFSAKPGGNRIPITVNINQHVALTTMWISNVNINQSVYSALITLDMSQLTNGITAAMLEQAAGDGIIVISQSSNPNLYAIILNNLQNLQLNLQLNTQGQTQATTFTTEPIVPEKTLNPGKPVVITR